MLNKYIKLIAIILCGIGIVAVLHGPGSAEMSAYGIEEVSVRHLDDDQIQLTMMLFDKDGYSVASNGELSVQIVDRRPGETPSWLGKPIATFIVDPETGQVAAVPPDSVPKEENTAEIYNKSYKVKKSEFSEEGYRFIWVSKPIKYSDFDRAADGMKCWVIISFKNPDGTVLKYDKLTPFNY